MKNLTIFQSKFEIGDPVKISINGVEIKGWIRTILFTNGKVKYSIKIRVEQENQDPIYTTFHNIDSMFIIFDPNGTKQEWELDNYG